MKRLKLGGALYMLFVYAFLLLPLIVVVASAFGETEAVLFPPRGFTLKWFREAFNNKEFFTSLFITLRLCVVSVIIATVLGIMVSLYFWKSKSKASTIFETVFTAPIIVPMVISAVAYMLFFSSFPSITTFWRLALAYAAIEMPYVIRSVTACLSTLDASFEEASLTLGASPVKTLMKVTLPNIKSGILVGMVFAFIVCFDESVIAMFMRNARTITFPVRLYTYITQSFTPLVSAWSTILIAFTFILIYFLDRKVGIGKMY